MRAEASGLDISRPRAAWAVVLVVLSCLTIADLPAAQQAGPTGRLNRIIEQFELGQPSFGSEHWVLTSLEHDPFLVDTLKKTLDSVRTEGARPKMTPIVRIAHEADQDYQHVVKQFLDAGAFGIILPHVKTIDEVTKLVRTMRYPAQPGAKFPEPPGNRGWGPSGALRLWGVSEAVYARKADVWPLNPEGELLAIIMIETREAVDNIDQILRVPGLGGVMIGAADLSLALGVGTPAPNPDAPEVKAAIAKVGRACMANTRVICGSFQATDLKGMIGQGYRLFTRANDPTLK